MPAIIGKEAPDFEIQAYFPEEGAVDKIRLSDYRGSWTVVCFYPADFTFV